MSDNFDALFGGDAVPKVARRRPGRPTREEAAAKLQAQQAQHASDAKAAIGRSFDDHGGIQTLRRPVTINTLATIFEHDVQTITKRLIDCPYKMHGARRLYSFKEAAAYIVKPRMTTEQFIRTLNKADLPPEINKALWDAQRSRLKFMLEAQEAWETEEVLAVFGDVFMTIKDHLQMAEEEMRERAGLSDDQARMLAEYLDELRAQLREKLVEMPKRRQTTSIIDKPMFGVKRDVRAEEVEIDDVDDLE